MPLTLSRSISLRGYMTLNHVHFQVRDLPTADQVLPFSEEQNLPLLRVLTDRGTEYCGNRECHEYQLYLAVENIDHSRTKAKSPQTDGICKRFHRTMQEEFYSVAFRKKLYTTLEELQSDLDIWLCAQSLSESHKRIGPCTESVGRYRDLLRVAWVRAGQLLLAP